MFTHLCRLLAVIFVTFALLPFSARAQEATKIIIQNDASLPGYVVGIWPGENGDRVQCPQNLPTVQWFQQPLDESGELEITIPPTLPLGWWWTGVYQFDREIYWYRLLDGTCLGQKIDPGSTGAYYVQGVLPATAVGIELPEVFRLVDAKLDSLRGSADLHRSRSRWFQATEIYQEMVEFSQRQPVHLTFEDHYWRGYEPALQVGDMLLAGAALRRAVALFPWEQATNQLASLLDGYGEVELITPRQLRGKIKLVCADCILDPRQSQFIETRLLQKKAELLLPAGYYTYGAITFEVTAGKLSRVSAVPENGARSSVAFGMGFMPVGDAAARTPVAAWVLLEPLRMPLGGVTISYQLFGGLSLDMVGVPRPVPWAGAGLTIGSRTLLPFQTTLDFAGGLAGGWGSFFTGCSLNETATELSDLNVICGVPQTSQKFTSRFGGWWFGPSVKLAATHAVGGKGGRLGVGVWAFAQLYPTIPGWPKDTDETVVVYDGPNRVGEVPVTFDRTLHPAVVVVPAFVVEF